MNISLNCKISLSKKLRALLGNKGSIVLTTFELVDGKGLGRLSLASEIEGGKYDASILDGETSIMIIPLSIGDEMPGAECVSSIFSTVPENAKTDKVVQKIAVVNPPEKGKEKYAMVSKEEIVTPQQFKELKNKECQKYIQDFEGLINAINAAKNKVSDISLEGITNVRELAVRKEEKEKAEAIDIPAYIVNDKYAVLTINDLDISLYLNVPYDLSNISARRIAASNSLKGLLKSGIVKFISPTQKEEYIEKASFGGVAKEDGLQDFDNPEQAEAAIASGLVSVDKQATFEISEKDIEAPTEEESIINLTKIPEKKVPFEGATISAHGSKTSTVVIPQKPTNVPSVHRKD